MNIKHIFKKTISTKEGRSSLISLAVALIGCVISAGLANGNRLVMYLAVGLSFAAMASCNAFIRAMMAVYNEENNING